MEKLLKDKIQDKLNLTHEQAIFVTLALEAARDNDWFKLDYGTFGAEHLINAIQAIKD